MYEYDEEFYRYISQGAVDSARQLLPVLRGVLPGPVESVLDVGCGAGAWLSVWKDPGTEVVGLDGDYLNPDQLMIEPQEFVAVDLSAGFDLQRRFGLAQSLEVAEHLPETAAARFVQCLCAHADLVLFSAAPPGQGGENHINEQPYEYWRRLFQDQGYDMHDPVRSALQGKNEVKPWYRYNTFLYVNTQCADLVTALSAHKVSESATAVDISPWLYQRRKQLIRVLPAGVSTLLAILKKTLFGLSLKFKRMLG
jgi:SAM-dependent methyltransferase